ncbi:MAG: hypothetical protein EBR28_00700, partial [Planctomycetia bacterium]|nr:hypothetical protein [Planctomycetia bacterium]
LLHIVVLLSMALIVQEPPKEEKPRVIVSSAPEVVENFEEFEEQPLEPQPDSPEVVSNEVVLPDATFVENVQVVSDAADLDAAPLAVEFTDFSTETAASSDLLASVGAIGGQAGGLGGRTDPSMRKKLVQTGGGNAQSEAAVEAGIKWIINHQLPDGSWSFDFSKCPSCGGNCSHPGKIQDRGGATAMALLPMLGRGYTHKEGPYKKQFEAGIGFLAGLTVNTQGKAYEKGGNLYSQGLAGIALSETYAMTQDKRLQGPAQLALNYIMAAQDPVGGGWRYTPKQPGDTSAVGWQLMALKSGHMAFLQVSPLTIKKAVEFLNRVQQDDGAVYGYTDPGNAYGTSAVGLLCRMYLGWKKDNPALQRGVLRLAKKGPGTDLYFDYYATQILHHVEGDAWVAWNAKMRDMLVKTQQTKGHATGSWFEEFDKGHGPEQGGRLYTTSMATMILEVYYRHLPLYGQQSVDEEFKE